MPTYRIIDFMASNNINLLGSYPDSEYINFLVNFKYATFEFDMEVKSLGVELLVPSNNREANVYFQSYTSEEIVDLQERGSKPLPIGKCIFTLWRDGRSEISNIVKW